MLDDAKGEIKIKNTKIKNIVAYTRLVEENHFNEHIKQEILFEISRVESNYDGQSQMTNFD